MEAVVIILAIFSVPLTAILSSTYLKAKKLALDTDAARNKEMLGRLLQEHGDLRRRMEVLESIAINERGLPSADSRVRGLIAAENLKELEERDAERERVEVALKR